MDYKIAYIEILEKLRKFLDCWRNCPTDNYSYEDVIDDLENRVPELKENEDERIRRELIDFIKDAKQSLELQERDNNKWQIEQFEIYIAWLEKQGAKKWSEEDTATISRAISIVKWTVNGNPSYAIINKQGADELVERLDFIKERHTWKPSEEQMTALRRMKAAVAGEGVVYNGLNSLYDDLVKLVGTGQ